VKLFPEGRLVLRGNADSGVADFETDGAGGVGGG
jgi:hypothetical protein